MTFKIDGKKTVVHFMVINHDTGHLYKRTPSPLAYIPYWYRKAKGENVKLIYEIKTFRKGIK